MSYANTCDIRTAVPRLYTTYFKPTAWLGRMDIAVAFAYDEVRNKAFNSRSFYSF
jgi:hypothetical protein